MLMGTDRSGLHAVGAHIQHRERNIFEARWPEHKHDAQDPELRSSHQDVWGIDACARACRDCACRVNITSPYKWTCQLMMFASLKKRSEEVNR